MEEMNKMIKPTIDDVRNAYCEDHDDFEEVYENADPSWRHGCYMTTVYKRLSDDTYWQVSWQRSGDGEYNSLRDKEIDTSDIVQVEPFSRTVIDYKPVGS